MEITPRTLREVVFRERLRGYDEDDVDEFLERVATGVEILQERLRHAVERAELAERRATERVEGDDAMRRTLTLAQRTADVAVAEARQEAARIVEEAKDQGRQLVQRSRELARRDAVEAQDRLRHDISQLEGAREQLRGDVAAFERYLDGERSRLRLALGDAIRWIEEAIPSLVPTPVMHHALIPPPPPEPEAPRIFEVREVAALESGPMPLEDAAQDGVPAHDGAPVYEVPPVVAEEAVSAQDESLPQDGVQAAGAEVVDAPAEAPPPHDSAPPHDQAPAFHDPVPPHDSAPPHEQAPTFHDTAPAHEDFFRVEADVVPVRDEHVRADETAVDEDALDNGEGDEDSTSGSSDGGLFHSRRAWWRRWSSSSTESDPSRLDESSEAHHGSAGANVVETPPEQAVSQEPSADAGQAPNPQSAGPSAGPYDHARSL